MRKLKFVLFFSILIQFVLFLPEGFSQNSVLQAGIAKIDITPSENLYMGGYDESGRPGKSDGVNGPIYIRALAFDDSSNRVVFIEADIVSLPPDNYTPLRNLISKETGIPFDNIFLGCVHNHAAPYPDERNIGSDWSKGLNNKFVSVVKDALADLEPVTIGGGTGKSFIGMNRRKKMVDTTSYITFDENNSSQSYGKYKTDNPVKIREMEGVCRLGNNPAGSIDEEVGVLRIDKASGKPKAVMVNYACHGTSLGCRNNKISPEWNGYMLQYIEREIPGVTGIFVQGASGDINPRFVGGLDGYTDNLKKTEDLGCEIGREVVRVFSEITTSQPVSSRIKLVHSDITCPRKYGAVVENFRNTTLDVPSTVIRIDQFIWVTFPGELFHEIGQNIKTMTHYGYAFIDGYCNGSLGYLPTQQAHSEGGYEPWSTKFDPAAEKIFVKGVGKMLTSFY
jgi:Neutral/alkaline non-lysosomal ceramidase, N-terminal